MEAIYIDADTGKISPFGRIADLNAAIAEGLNSAPNSPPEERMDAHRWRMDGAEMNRKAALLLPHQVQALARAGWRMDAIEAGNSLGLPQDFQYVYARELEERRKPLRGMELFRRDASVPAGATSYKVVRGSDYGEAKIYSGSDRDVPVVGVGRRAAVRTVKYIVTSYSGNVIDLMATDFAGLGELARKRKAAQRAVDEKVNNLIWFGDNKADLWGALSHPDLPRFVTSTKFDGTATPVAVLAALNRAANFAHDESGSAFRSNRMAVSHRVRSYIFNTPMFSGGSDLTIGKYFLQNQEFIKAIDSASELRGIGPNGEDGILCYSDDVDSSGFVMPMDYTELPQQFSGFERRTYAFASFGGVRMDDVGNNVLMYVEI